MLGTTAAVLVVPSAAKLWVPDTELIAPEEGLILPVKELEAASDNGDLVFGWVLPEDIASEPSISGYIHFLLEDAIRYFPASSPILALRGRSIRDAKKVPENARRLERFAWRGNGSPLDDGEPYIIKGAWKNYGEMLAPIMLTRKD